MSSTSPWKSLATIAVAAACVYGQSLRFGFVNYDDDELVYHNSTFLSSWKNAGPAFSSHAFAAAGGESVYYRPLLLVSFIVDFHLWGLNPLGFHLVNLVLHIIFCCFVFLLARSLVEDEFSALCAGLIAALHPIQTESVAWIAGRNDVLLAVFVVSTVIFYRRWTQSPAQMVFWILSVGSFLLALMTKESAVFYIAAIPLCDLLSPVRSVRDMFSLRSLRRFIPFVVIVILYLIARLRLFGAIIGAERLYGHLPIGERFSNIPPLVAEHLGLMLFPLNLSVAHPADALLWLRSPWYGAAILACAASVFLIGFAWKRDRVMGFALSWIAIGFLPLLGLIPVPIPILEHRLYVPMVGFSIAAGRIISIVSRRTPDLARASAIAVTAAMGIMSFSRLPVWHDGAKLFEDAIVKAPTYAPSYFSLAGSYYEAQAYPAAASAIQGYIARAPDDPRGYLFFRDILSLEGKIPEAADVSRQLTFIDKRPVRFLEAGSFYEQLRSYDSAAAIYSRGLTFHDSSDDIHFRLGVAEAQLGRLADAEREFRRVLQINPSSAQAVLVLARICEAQGKRADAIAILENWSKADHPTKPLFDLLRSLYIKNGDSVKIRELPVP